MIKSELVQRISMASPHLYRRDAEKVVNAILDEITTAMARGDRVELRGFGSFLVKNRPARTGRNPRTEAFLEVRQKRFTVFQNWEGDAGARKQARPKLRLLGTSGYSPRKP